MKAGPVSRLVWMRMWGRLARSIEIRGPMPVKFSVSRGRLIATVQTLPVGDVGSVTEGLYTSFRFTRAIPRSLAPTAAWILGFARWIYLHEIDEWWFVNGERGRVPHDELGSVRVALTIKRWSEIARFAEVGSR